MRPKARGRGLRRGFKGSCQPLMPRLDEETQGQAYRQQKAMEVVPGGGSLPTPFTLHEHQR